MSMTTNKKGEIIFQKKGAGIKDIFSVVRRGMRMNDKQRRFALTISTILVFALIFVILFAAGKANNTVTINENAAALSDAIGAERIEMGKKTIELNQEYGSKTVDLYLRLKRMSFCIYDSRYDIDECHEDRKNIYGEASYHEGCIFFSKICNEAE